MSGFLKNTLGVFGKTFLNLFFQYISMRKIVVTHPRPVNHTVVHVCFVVVFIKERRKEIPSYIRHTRLRARIGFCACFTWNSTFFWVNRICKGSWEVAPWGVRYASLQDRRYLFSRFSGAELAHVSFSTPTSPWLSLAWARKHNARSEGSNIKWQSCKGPAN